VLLRNKSAIVYGAGAVGGAVARTFAAEGAAVFLASRTQKSLESVAKDIVNAGGRAEFAQVDALDAEAVERHAAAVAAKAGRIDVSFNAISLGGTQGAPLVETPQDQFVIPITTAMRSHFLTATATGRHMAKAGSGVILAITAQAARKPYSNVGGFGVAGAAIEGLCRQLAIELGPAGIRVVCLCSPGSPDTPGLKDVWRKHAEKAGVAPDAFERAIADRTMLKRLPGLVEIANVAALMASDLASPITGAIANATCGEIAD
jgi:NAD(P)-dependent dehydrogenase (short-subunit alcohol dehydrogenase family)